MADLDTLDLDFFTAEGLDWDASVFTPSGAPTAEDVPVGPDHLFDFDTKADFGALTPTASVCPSSDTASTGSAQPSPPYGAVKCLLQTASIAPVASVAPAKLAPLLPRPLAPAPGSLKRPASSDSEHSATESDTLVKKACGGGDSKAAERERARVRAEKNRQSAANSRLKQKQMMVELSEEVTTLRAAVAAREDEVLRLRMENRSLSEQVAFFRSVIGSKLGSHDLPGMLASPAAPSRPIATGVVCLTIVLAMAVCVFPGGPAAAWTHGAAAGVPSGAAFGAGRVLLNQPGSVMTEAVVPGAAPPVPALLWSPTAALTMALVSAGWQDSARWVLSHGLAVAVAIAALLLARRSAKQEAPVVHVLPQASQPDVLPFTKVTAAPLHS